MSDPVNHPSHYTAGGIECIDAIAAALVGLTGEEAYDTGAAIKYLWRWKKKNGVEDLRKAIWYINRLIEKQETSSVELDSDLGELRVLTDRAIRLKSEGQPYEQEM